MADAKQQVHLNGAYYGPPVPPRNRSFRSVGRSSGCCCGPCCLVCNLFKFLLSLVIALGVVILVLWLVFRPNQPKARVETASLTQFDLANSTTLSYNLSFDLTVRNPNRRMSFYYDRLEARAEYDGDRFGFTNLPTFYQGHKNTTVIRTIHFGGTQPMFGDSVDETYRRERSEGFYYIDVKVRAKMRVKVWIFKLRYNRPHIDCTLKLPVPGSGGVFESTGCDVHIF
ncbi:NDR1/HIN1-like protein 3 [Zingiber officinale]|uniref:Late embryogenesis abundant protein LEA-2 subgroup domain-containing protein n=1 Tax=Zingiber officinale TaxID=94328 RepID=A0A8J5LTL5_ZINOF|nr:NDR1/HIN1-like protein 3 [Zingiber officinale]KAG6522900.1 hypothetical protein ZIOFF_020056 [Zingiber officinale]